MGKGKNFSEFTYGVGLEITAQSFKQVKDDLKMNFNSLAKMIKSYEKVLKIDPDADLSKLFEEMRKVQSIINGINGSGNSFAGFVDKGTLGNIAAMEERLSSIDSTSDRVQTQLNELKSTIIEFIKPLKEAGNIKFPATFENLFGSFEDQSSKIKSVSDSIAVLRNTIKELEETSKSASDIYSNVNIKSSNLDTKQIEQLISKFFDIRNQLLNISDLNPSQAKDAVAQIKDVGIQLAGAIKGLSTEYLLDNFGIDDTIIVTEIDELVNAIKSKKDSLATELTGLKDLQAKFIDSTKAKKSSKSTSLGLQPDITAQVKVTPKANDTEWVNAINDTIKNIEPHLHKVHLTPTFSKSKNIDKEIEGNLAQINHAVDVELKVNHNVEEFNKQINNIDTSIKNAKERLEKNGNFHIKFEYEEGGNFKSVAYNIINQLKKVEVHVDNQTSKNFLKELGDLRTKANAELKNIRATVKFNSFNNLIKAVDTLKAGIDNKIGKADINLNITNEPQIITQATLIRDKLAELYDKIPVNLGLNAIVPETTVSGSTNEVEQLSDAAKAAKKDLEKCKQVLASLNEHGFNAPEFLQLGDISPDGKRIKDSEKKLEELLNKYKLLQEKLPDDIGERWRDIYPEANGDINVASNMAKQVRAELKQLESELNLYLQKQLAYAQARYNQNEAIIKQEKEIATVQKDQQPPATTAEAPAVQANEQLAVSADEAAKKVRSLNTILAHQRKHLQNLEENGGWKNSESFIKLGEWDEENKVFKKNSSDIKKLIERYNELRDARIKAGGANKTVKGEEASIRNRLSQIYAKQKKHLAEIIQQNEQELASAKEIVNARKEAAKNTERPSNEQTKQDIAIITKNVEQLTNKLNKATEAKSKLESNGLTAVASTGLGDNKKVLQTAGRKENLKELVSLYEQLIARKKELETSGGTSRSETKINEQINSLMKAKQLLNSKGFFGLAETQLGDVKGRLGSDPQELRTLISQYHQLLIAKKEFEQNGDTTSEDYLNTSKALEGATQQLKILYQDQLQAINTRIEALQTEASQRTEYVRVSQECKNIESILADVHKNQVDYANQRIELYDKQLTQAQELLRVEQQRAQIEMKQPEQSNDGASATETRLTATSPSGDETQMSGVVKLDSSTLNSLAKDVTLKSIDGKVSNILGQLGKGINITGSNISIEASNVSVTGGNTSSDSKVSNENKHTATSENNPVVNQTSENKQLSTSAENAKNKQNDLKKEIKDTQEQTEYMLSSTVSLVREVNGEIAASTDIYKTSDKVEEKAEKWGWVSHGENEPPTFEHTSTVYKTNIEAYNKMYNDYIKSLSKQMELQAKIESADGPTSKMQAELNIQKEITNQLELQLQRHSELFTEQSKQEAMLNAAKKAQQEIEKSVGAQRDKDVKKQNNELLKIVDGAQSKLNEMQYSMQNSKVPMADAAIAKFKQYEQLLSTLKLKQQEIKLNPDLLKDADYSNGFNSLLQQMDAVEEEFAELQKSSASFLSKISSLDDIKRLGTSFDPGNIEQMRDVMQEFADQAGIGTAKLIEFNDAERSATFEINDGRGHIQQLTVAYDSATNSLGRYIGKTRESTSETKKFLNSLKHSFQNVARYIASFGSVYRLFAIIKQGISYVRDIDSALTELKKVTDETDASYEQFLQDMSKTGKIVGATVQDLTTMASEWARLGYSMQEAGQLAQSTAILLNVSEFDDATKASEALISTMQAFQYTADESGRVVDILNEVGNNYAVSSNGIATALQDSASALMAGGNNLEQAVALVASANRVVQDPNSVGKQYCRR